MVRLVLEAAAGKKAEALVALNLKNIASFTDCFVICSGAQSRQTRAICDAILEALGVKGVRPGHVEGYDRGDWILIDLSDLIIHIFTRETREFYNLERLWGDAPGFELERTETRRKRGTSAARKG
ncbi:MAG TPA: ribosome silencing factor [Candidatus Polarisedimenticolia bacterium]|nr:ribosome silencing factor [Candidatus Polarisedimenticolia bacterium]